nr:choice-of-anchor D domain-containing protein [Chitinophagaceae bacterium]
MKHKRCYIKMLIFFLLMQGGMLSHAQIAYLAFNSTTVKAYDINTNTVIANISVSQVPTRLIPHPDGTKVYLLNSLIQVLDVATQTITNTINVNETLMSTCISHDGQFLYFNTLVPNVYPYEVKLYKLNTQTNVVSYLALLQNGYSDMSISPNDDKLYLVGASEAIVFNTTNFSSYSTIPLLVPNTFGQTMCCLNNDGSKLFVTGETTGRFNIINTLNYTVDTSCLFGPWGGFQSVTCMQYNPVTNSIYVAGIDGTSAGKWISYNIATNQVENTIIFNPFLSPLSMAINEEGTLCYTAGGELINAGTIRTINTTNNSIVPGLTNIGTIWNRSKSFIVKLRPEIDIQVGTSNQSITDGDNTPSLSDKTDFGNVNTTGYATQIYKIKNTGLAPLHIPTISLTGPNASMFTISAMPMDIPVGGVDSFAVYFYPSSPGIKSAVVNIDNNDFNEGVYDFAIQGTGTLPKYVYTTQAAANTVGVVDRNTNQYVMDINVGSYPNGMCFNQTKSKLFVTNSNSNDVSVINTITNSVMQTIPVGNYPIGI